MLCPLHRHLYTRFRGKFKMLLFMHTDTLMYEQNMLSNTQGMQHVQDLNNTQFACLIVAHIGFTAMPNMKIHFHLKM